MHTARHTFVCMAVEYGMPIDVLAKILGRSNTKVAHHYAKPYILFRQRPFGRGFLESAHFERVERVVRFLDWAVGDCAVV